SGAGRREFEPAFAPDARQPRPAGPPPVGALQPPQRIRRGGRRSGSARHEPLVGTIDGTMDDRGTVPLTVLADVFEVESFRRLVVELNRRELPGPTESVVDVDVDLRSVEGAIALLDLERQANRLERPGQRALSLVPELLRTERLFRFGAQIVAPLEAEQVVHELAELEHR